jgi:hypothetical protein
MEPDLVRMAQLSRRYARYGHSLPGLSLALGAAVMFGFFFAGPFLGNHTEVCPANQFSLLALTAAALLAGWIILKEWIRGRVYQSLGMAQPMESIAEPFLNRLLALLLTLLALSYPVRALAALPHPDPAPTAYQIAIGLAACCALPWATLRFIRGLQEAILWVVLAFFTLEFVWGLPNLSARGGHPAAMAAIAILSFLLVCFGGMAAGLLQHFSFLRLAREVRAQEPRDE